MTTSTGNSSGNLPESPSPHAVSAAPAAPGPRASAPAASTSAASTSASETRAARRGVLELVAAMVLSGTIGLFVLESGASPSTAA